MAALNFVLQQQSVAMPQTDPAVTYYISYGYFAGAGLDPVYQAVAMRSTGGTDLGNFSTFDEARTACQTDWDK